MHKIQLGEGLILTRLGVHFEPNKWYFTDSATIGALATAVDGKITALPADIDTPRPADPRKILVVRMGGVGDLLFTTPLLREIKRLYPRATVHFSTVKSNEWILANSGLIDGFYFFPMSASPENNRVGDYDWVINLENVVEYTTDKHVVDAFTDHAGVPLSDKTTFYRPLRSAESFAERFPKTRKRIAVQLTASSPVRTYAHVGTLIGLLLNQGYEVATYNFPGQVKIDNPGVIDLAAINPSFQENVDFLQTCDACIGPDSSIVHFAGALGIPTIGLYGPFPWEIRTAYQQSILAISGRGECAPCFHHGRRGHTFPPGKPCAKTNRCEVLAAIDPQVIVATLQKKIGILP